MRKLRDDSTWNQLSVEQRERLEGWLFDENLGYEKTVVRVREEFGLAASVASVGRYFRRRARERQVEELVEAQAAADELNQLPVSTGQLRAAAMKLVAKVAMKLVSEHPDRLDELVDMARLLLDSEANEIRRDRLRLAEKCFDYEATAASTQELPRLRAYLGVIAGDANLSHEDKLERVNAILYGWHRGASSAVIATAAPGNGG